MLKRNITANVLGGSLTALVSVLLIPVQVHFLGVPAYGLLAFVASIQILFSIFDFGLSPTITREVAKDTSSELGRTRGMVRSFSLIYWPIGIAIGLALFVASGWLADHWLNVGTGTLPSHKVTSAIRLAAIAIAIRWPVSLYGGVLAGRQRFDLLNGVRASVAIVNSVGGVAVLVVTGDLISYMTWTIASAAIEVAAYLFVLLRLLPGLLVGPKLLPQLDKSILSFARGLTLINLLTMLLTQSDRLLISKLLAIQALGYYALAYNILFGLSLIQNFVTSAMFPAFASSGEEATSIHFRQRYEKSLQGLLYVYSFPIWFLVFFGRDLLVPVTSVDTANQVAPVLAILGLGFLCNACASIAYTAAVATGNTAIPIRVNLVAIWWYIPVLAGVTAGFGILGTASAWLVLNAYFALTIVPLVNRIIVKTAAFGGLVRNCVPFVLLAAMLCGLPRLLLIAFGQHVSVSGVVAIAAVTWATYSVIGFTFLGSPLKTDFVTVLRGAILLRLASRE